MQTIQVQTRSPYPIWIDRGILSQSGALLRERTKANAAAIITDDVVDALYGDTVQDSLAESGFRVAKFVFPNGESQKCSATLNRIYDFLCENALTRADCVVALGGGVVGDLAGFAAATFLRGIDYLQIPTTLLSQVDSSVGGKTAIDCAGGKNLIGAFKQPIGVVCDPETLSSLPDVLLSDGLGEVIKYGMIWDEALFQTLEEHDLHTIGQTFNTVIPACIDIKRQVVEADEYETGLRMILNYGHTFAHAIERYYHYKTYTHGSAVAAGMCVMARKTAPPAVYERLCHCVERYDLPTNVPAPLGSLVPLCRADKKRADDIMRFIVCEKIGKAEIRSMPFSQFAAWMLSAEGAPCR